MLAPFWLLCILWNVRATTNHLELSRQRFQWIKTAYKSNLYFGNSKNLTKSVGILHTIRKFFVRNIKKNTIKIYWKIQDPHIKTTNPLFGTWGALVSVVDFWWKIKLWQGQTKYNKGYKWWQYNYMTWHDP